MPRATISFAESAVRDLEEVRVWCVEQELTDVGTRLVEEISSVLKRWLSIPTWGGL